MKHAKKMKLVECNDNDDTTSSTNIRVSLSKPLADGGYTKPFHLFNLDCAMRKILEENIPDREKWKLYYQTLNKYLNYSKFNKNPTSSEERNSSKVIFCSSFPPEIESDISYASSSSSSDENQFQSLSSTLNNNTVVGDSLEHSHSSQNESVNKPCSSSAHESVKKKRNKRRFIHNVSDVVNRSSEIPKTRTRAHEDHHRTENRVDQKCYVALEKWFHSNLKK